METAMKNGAIGWLPLLFALVIGLPHSVCADLILVHGWNFTLYEESNGAFIRENFSNSEGLGRPVLGQDGQLYATRNGMGQGAILRVGETTKPNDVFVPYGSAGFTAPFGMAFGTNGDIYAGSIVFTNFTFGYGRILQFNGSTGEFIRESVPARSNILPSPTGMATGPDGWIYVTDSQLGLARFAPVGSARESLATNVVSFPHFGPDGTLYVKSSNTVIQRFDQTSKTFSPFIDAADFGITNGIVGAFGPNGLYYFATSTPPDPGSALPRSKVYRYDPRARRLLGVFAIVQSDFYPHWVSSIAFSGTHVSISSSASGATVRYPKILSGFALEQSNSIEAGAIWTPNPDPPFQIGMELVVTNTANDGARFFRLRR